MNKIKKIGFLLVTCFLGTVAFAGSDLIDSKPSKQKAVEFIDGEDSEWVTLVKELGDQRFILEFPKRPILKKIDANRYTFSTHDSGIDYCLTVDTKVSEGDDELWMQNSLEKMIADASKSLVKFFVDVDLLGPFMEVSYIQDGKIVRERIFTHSGHVFSIASKGSSLGDDRFFQSFQIFDSP